MSTLITIDKITVGMKLAEPVKNKLGQLLFAVGVTLEEKHKKIFSTWGITSIYIQDVDNQESNIVFDMNSYPAAKEELSKRLKWVPRNAVEEDLFEIAVKKILENDL